MWVKLLLWVGGRETHPDILCSDEIIIDIQILYIIALVNIGVLSKGYGWGIFLECKAFGNEGVTRYY